MLAKGDAHRLGATSRRPAHRNRAGRPLVGRQHRAAHGPLDRSSSRAEMSVRQMAGGPAGGPSPRENSRVAWDSTAKAREGTVRPPCLETLRTVLSRASPSCHRPRQRVPRGLDPGARSMVNISTDFVDTPRSGAYNY